ncbi:MAG: MFS transporter [Candidatus Dormibacterales bacterium]
MTPRYRWVVLGVGAGAQAALSASAYGLSAIAPAIRSRYGLDLVQTGTVLTAVMAGMALTNLLWGAATDRFGEAKTLLGGLAGAAAALIGAAFVPGYLSLLAALVAAGMLGCVAVSAGGRAIMAWFPLRERGTALGIRQMTVPLGGGLAALGLPPLLFRFGLGACLLGLGAFLALAAAAGPLMRRAPRPEGARPAPGPSPLRDLRIWRVASAGALMMAGQMSLVTYLTTFLTHRGLGLAAAAALLALLQWTGAAGLVAMGRASDRLGTRIGVLRISALASSAGLVGLGLAAGAALPLVLALLIATGLVSLTWNGLNFTATAEIAGSARAGTALGLQATLFACASVGGPVAFAALVAAGGWTWGYVFAGGLGLLALWLLNPLAVQERAGWGAPAEAQAHPTQAPPGRPGAS